MHDVLLKRTYNPLLWGFLASKHLPRLTCSCLKNLFWDHMERIKQDLERWKNKTYLAGTESILWYFNNECSAQGELISNGTHSNLKRKTCSAAKSNQKIHMECEKVFLSKIPSRFTISGLWNIRWRQTAAKTYMVGNSSLMPSFDDWPRFCTRPV